MAADPRAGRERRGSTRLLLQLAAPWWRSAGRVRIRAATALLVALTVAQVGISVWGNYWNRALFDALEQRAVRDLLVQVGIFAVILAVSAGVTAAHLGVKRWLQLDWRRWLTERLTGAWLAEGRQHRLPLMPGEHDNPDARIAEDVRIATEVAVALAHTLVFAVLSLVLFIGILWDVSGTLRLPGSGVAVPGYLVPLAFAYAGAGTLLGWLLGRPLVRTTAALQGTEADFRFGLARSREHAEAIALARGEGRERLAARDRFRALARDWHRQSLAYVGIVSFGTAYGALLPVFPILVAAPQYILGAMSLGLLMQAAQAFQRVASALSWPVDNLGEIARCRASADRVLTLLQDLERLAAPGAVAVTSGICVAPGDGPRLVVSGLTVADAGGRVLLERLDAEIRRGERVLVTGDAIAATTFFKVLAGLWPWGSGEVRLPRDARIAWMPQQPYLPPGSLRAAVCYPAAPETCGLPAIRYALECAGVAWLAPRLAEVADWDRVLPLRVRQRLAFARTLLQRPAWIIMDQASDAGDARRERLVFDMLRHELPDTTIVTIGFHPELGALHDRTLRLRRVASQPNADGSQPRATASRKHQAGVVSVR